MYNSMKTSNPEEIYIININSSSLKSRITIQEEKEDSLSLNILNKIDRKLISISINEKKVFQFFSKIDKMEKINNNSMNNKLNSNFLLFDKIFIIEYLYQNYFFYNIEENYHQIIKTKYQVELWMRETLQQWEVST